MRLESPQPAARSSADLPQGSWMFPCVGVGWGLGKGACVLQAHAQPSWQPRLDPEPCTEPLLGALNGALSSLSVG